MSAISERSRWHRSANLLKNLMTNYGNLFWTAKAAKTRPTTLFMNSASADVSAEEQCSGFYMNKTELNPVFSQTFMGFEQTSEQTSSSLVMFNYVNITINRLYAKNKRVLFQIQRRFPVMSWKLIKKRNAIYFCSHKHTPFLFWAERVTAHARSDSWPDD